MTAKDYWNKEIGFENEFIVYEYLCDAISKRKKRKLKIELKFRYYSDWKSYVKDNNRKRKCVELTELSRYLNHQERSVGMNNNSLYILLIPFLVSLFSNIIWNYFNTIQYFPADDLIELFSLIPIINVIKYPMILFTIGTLIMLIPMILMFYLILSMETVKKSELRKSFYKDYKEIVDELISENTTTSPGKGEYSHISHL